MKSSPLYLVGLLSLASWLAPVCGYGEPVLRYEFNLPGAIQKSSGSSELALTTYNAEREAVDLIREAPVKRFGADEGYALDFTESGFGGAVQGEITLRNAPDLTANLRSFTITAWLLDVEPAAARRLFYLSGPGGATIDLCFTKDTAGSRLQLAVAGQNAVRSAATVTVPARSSTWYFIAVSYEADTGLVTFHSGAEGAGPVFSTASILNGKGDPYLLPTDSRRLNIGNSLATDRRRIRAYLSDLRFYGSALDRQQITAIAREKFPF